MPSPASAADKNLAEMAQRLEAALRRPGAQPAPRPIRAPPVAPDVPSNRAAPPPRPAASPRRACGSAGRRSKPSADAPKTQFKNLEDEMASLLGRPKTPS